MQICYAIYDATAPANPMFLSTFSLQPGCCFVTYYTRKAALDVRDWDWVVAWRGVLFVPQSQRREHMCMPVQPHTHLLIKMLLFFLFFTLSPFHPSWISCQAQNDLHNLKKLPSVSRKPIFHFFLSLSFKYVCQNHFCVFAVRFCCYVSLKCNLPPFSSVHHLLLDSCCCCFTRNVLCNLSPVTV